MRWRDLLSLQTEHPLPEDFFETPRRVHFLGIGGIGMSALALLLRARGHVVSGSDERDGAMPRKLREAGIEVFIGHDAKNVAGAQAIFYSSAIPGDNPEWLGARQKQIPLYHRAQLLAHVSNRAKVSIAVSGTHGKSTTSAMIAHILTQTGCNPTAILGAVYPPFESNLRIGDPDLVVVEADESDGSFTLLQPTVAVVLNVEPEHLENYDESEAELWRAFEMFVERAKQSVLNANDKASIAQLGAGKTVTFGTKTQAGLEFTNVFQSQGRTKYDLSGEVADDHCGPFQIPVPGLHNVANAAAAVCATKILNVEAAEAASALETFAGTLRRFERKGEAGGVLVYDDYGHHPTEVRATLGAAAEFLRRPLCVVFQPHRYSRTQALWREFGTAFGAADCIIITQIYSAHETPIAGVSGALVFDAVRANNPGKRVFYAETLDQALALTVENVRPGDALLTMGAGDVTTLGARVLAALG